MVESGLKVKSESIRPFKTMCERKHPFLKIFVVVQVPKNSRDEGLGGYLPSEIKDAFLSIEEVQALYKKLYKSDLDEQFRPKIVRCEPHWLSDLIGSIIVPIASWTVGYEQGTELSPRAVGKIYRILQTKYAKLSQ